MASIVFDPETFSVQTLQACLKYVTDSFQWLTANGTRSSEPSESSELGLPTIETLAEGTVQLLANIRSVQNSYARINCLPPEILSAIFEGISRPLPTPQVGCYGDEGESGQWTVINRVCRHWRRIAVSTPGLWAVIFFKATSMMHVSSCKASLSLAWRRSGGLPISAYIRLPVDTDPTIPEMIAEIPLDRAKDLRLVGIDTEALQSLSSRAELLETLHIQEANPSPVDHSRPSSLFDEWQVPRLRTLVMESCVAWKTGTFGRLRCLIIHMQSFDLSSIHGLFDVLSHNLLLEDLDVREFTTSRQDDPTVRAYIHAHPRLEMPKLVRIYIAQAPTRRSSGVQTPLPLNAKIVSGSDTWARRYGAWSRTNDQDYSDVFALHIPLPVTSLCIGETLVGTDGRTAIHISPTIGSITSADLVHAVIPLSEVRELWLKTYQLSLPVAAQHMQSVHTLTIWGSVLADWMTQAAAHNLFPVLQDLQIIIHTRWHRVQSADDPLFDFLQRKQASGKKVRRLRLVRLNGEFWNPATSPFIFKGWSYTMEDFAHLVDSVSLDEAAGDWHSWMSLPTVCTTSSSHYDFWESWEHLWG